MPMAPDKKWNFILSQALTNLGAPIIDSEATDSDIVNSGIKDASLMEYYRSMPYGIWKFYDFDDGGVLPVGLSPIITEVAGLAKIEEEKIFFVGVMNMQFTGTAFLNKFSGQFLPYLGNQPQNYFEQLYQATLEDINYADPYCEHDAVLNRLTIMAGGPGSLAVQMAFGFYDIKFVPDKHLILLSKIVAKNILLPVIASRKAINLGDITLDADFISGRYDTLNGEISDMLKDMAPAMIMWG